MTEKRVETKTGTGIERKVEGERMKTDTEGGGMVCFT